MLWGWVCTFDAVRRPARVPGTCPYLRPPAGSGSVGLCPAPERRENSTEKNTTPTNHHGVHTQKNRQPAPAAGIGSTPAAQRGRPAANLPVRRPPCCAARPAQRYIYSCPGGGGGAAELAAAGAGWQRPHTDMRLIMANIGMYHLRARQGPASTTARQANGTPLPDASPITSACHAAT